MRINNFTTSDIWKQSNRIRFDIKNVVELNDVDFLIKNNEIQCLQFFNVYFSENLLKLIKNSIVNDKNVVFKYIDLTKDQLLKLKDWCLSNNLKLKINDEWDAPFLFLNQPLNEYIKGKSQLLKRDYARLKKDNLLEYKIFNKNNLKMWADVLKIDRDSWKGENSCDMKSLEREDLQYIFYLLNNSQNSSLIVSYYQNQPVAYSLWFKATDSDVWYAAKWEASNSGRTLYAGIKTLLYHIETMQTNHNELQLDFWGRRSQFYDMLKNREVKRYHFQIGRADD